MLPRVLLTHCLPLPTGITAPGVLLGIAQGVQTGLQLHFISTKVLALTAALGMGSEGPGERVRGPPGDLDGALLGEAPGATGASWAAPPPAGSAGTGRSSSCGASGAGCPGTDEP